jgi:hypothetical protein
MLVLLLILLICGFLQSLYELKKDENANSNIKRTLSIIYIAILIISVIVLIIKNNQEKKLGSLIENISTSLSQIDQLSISLDSTNSLLSKSDSINKNIISILSIRDSLLGEFDDINSILSEQLKIDKSKIEERSSKIGLYDSDITWDGNDSTWWSILCSVRNYGDRNAVITRTKGFALIYDKNHKIYSSFLFRETNSQSLLEPLNNGHMARTVIISQGIGKQFNFIKNSFTIITFYLLVDYYDILSKKPMFEEFYKSWSPNEGFGNATDEQIKDLKRNIN